MRDFSRIIPNQAALAEDVGTPAKALDSLADNALRMSQPVYRRGIDPIYSVVQSSANRGDGFLVILPSPRELPFSAADRPSSNPDRRDFQVALSKRS
jgi:hypothetical protein